MLIKPESCVGCPLQFSGLGFMVAEGFPRLGVTLVGEALGEVEAKKGLPFQGPAGFRFERMIERAGYTRDQFQILNAAWCQPPGNRQPTDQEVDHCRQYWEPRLKADETKVIVPMGNVPLLATLNLEGITSKRGYVWWSDEYNAYILPTVHPSYIMRGNANWEAAFMYDLRHAVEIAREGWEPIERDYAIDPTPNDAAIWCETFKQVLYAYPGLFLGTDIETPEKAQGDEDEIDISLGYQAGVIYRIGFAYVHPATGRTHSLTVPWTPSYLEIIQSILVAGAELIFCNRHFDVPRIKAHGLGLSIVRDLQEAWHVLHTDLPKKLEFITPFLCPRQPAWKHLNVGDTAPIYNAIDAAVQVEGMLRLRELMRGHRMWDVPYEADIHDLNPILVFMSAQGMPVDVEKRKEASLKCMELMDDAKERINKAAEGARPEKIYKKFRPGLESTTITVEETICSECGKKAGPKHPHFHCGTASGEVPLGERTTRVVEATAYIQPLDFKPSQKGLIRYAKFKGYKLITRWNKEEQCQKVTMDETAVRQYALRHETDSLWPLVLEYKELQTLLTRYIGVLKPKPEKKYEWKWEPKEPVPYEQDDDIPF